MVASGLVRLLNEILQELNNLYFEERTVKAHRAFSFVAYLEKCFFTFFVKLNKTYECTREMLKAAASDPKKLNHDKNPYLVSASKQY